MSRRAAFIINAKTGPELQAGKKDALRMAEVLFDQELGGCASDLSLEPIFDCESGTSFLGQFQNFLQKSAEATFRIIYFSGHGENKNGTFSLVFDDPASPRIPFDTLPAFLKGYGLLNSLFVLDTCHSGAANLQGLKSSEDFLSPLLNTGSCVFASSRDNQFSYEREDGEGSEFTVRLCECIESGLGGQATKQGLITVPDATDYINGSIQNASNSATSRPQTAVYSINLADGHIWIAKNRSGSSQQAEPESSHSSVGGWNERVVLDAIDDSRAPCFGASIAELDEDLVRRFARNVGFDAGIERNQLYAEIGLQFEGNGKHPTTAAILSFGKRPEKFFPQSCVGVRFGELSAEHFSTKWFNGNVFRLLTESVSEIQRGLGGRSTIDSSGIRADDYEIPASVIREAMSNAIAHRDYEAPQRILVSVLEDKIEIRNPGSFPDNFSWSDLLTSPGHSFTRNAAISRFLQGLGGFEGFGRGFEVFQKYREENGPEAITFSNFAENTVVVTIRRPVAFAAVQEALLSQSKAQLLHRSLARRHEAVPVSEMFVPSTVTRSDGSRISIDSELQPMDALSRRSLLIGGPGSGKTLIAKMLINNMIDSLEGKLGVVPVFVQLRSLSRVDSLLENLARLAQVDEKAFRKLVENGQTYLIFDGVDELDIADRSIFVKQLLELVRRFPSLRLLVTTRSDPRVEKLLQSEGFDALSTGHWDRVEIRRFVEQRVRSLYGTSRGPDFEASVLKSLQATPDIASSPLLLELFMMQHGDRANLTRSLSSFWESSLRAILVEHDATKSSFVREGTLSRGDLRDVLEAFALFSLIDRIRVFDQQTMLKLLGSAVDIVGVSARAEDVLSDFETSGVVVLDQASFVFVNRSLHEYLAASYLSRGEVSLEQGLQILSEYFEDTRDVSFIEMALEQWSNRRRSRRRNSTRDCRSTILVEYKARKLRTHFVRELFRVSEELLVGRGRSRLEELVNREF